MSTNYFIHQETVAKNLILFMREKGYSRLSFSKLADVPRSAVDQLLLRGGESINEAVYNVYILRINQTFNLAEDYLLKETSKPDYLSSAPPTQTERSAKAQELLDILDNVLDVYSMYIK